MKRTIALILKELLMVLRDKKVRISILVPPIVQLFIFTYAATLDVKNVPIGICNRDNGAQSFELIERFYGAECFNKKIVFLKGVEEIAPFIEEQKGVMVISIDALFSRHLEENKPATVQLILDGRKSNTAQIVAGYTSEIIRTFNNDLTDLLDQKVQKTILVPRTFFNPNLLYYWYNIPCLVALLAMITCLVVTSQSVSRERELGTFDQLLVSPLSPFQILVGKLVPGIVTGFIEGLIMLFLGTCLLKVPFTGSLLVYFLSLFIFVCSISGIGLFLASITATQQQAMLASFVFLTPSILISGFATPIENMPTWLQPLTYLVPLRYMLIISKGLFLKAMPFSIVLSQLWPLLGIATLNLFFSGLFFKRRVD